MGTTKATKAADKSQVCRKLANALHKLYGKSVPKIELPVVETMLFAACLEDNSWAPAEAGFRQLLSSFFDLNEIRVSSVNELELVLAPLNKADWKGLRIRAILRHIFETTYSYDFEKLRRQTLEQAVKTLKKMPDLSPFIRAFVLHEILGSHLVCLDGSMLTAAKWLGLVPGNSDVDDASEYLKGGLKKSEVSEFCYLLRCLATDPKFVPRFTDHADSEQSMDSVMDRFAELQLPPKKKPVKPPAPKEAVKPVKAEAAKKVAPAATGTAASKVISKSHGKTASAAKSAAPATKAKATATAKSASKATPKPSTSKPAAKKKPASSPGKPSSGGKPTSAKPTRKK